MQLRPLRRAAALSLAALLAFAGTTSADGLLADGDADTTIVEGTKHLGTVGAGSEVSVDVRFVLTCTGLGHVDAGQSVVVTSAGGIQPGDGQIVSVTTATLDPVPSGWTVDGVGCPDSVSPLEGGDFSRVTLRAPTTPANGYEFTIVWDRSLQPAGNVDGSAFTRTMTSVTFTMNVVGNLRPTLLVPSDFTVEGDTTGGWKADWSGVSATDPEDAPDPLPSCSPAAGRVMALGSTPVSCSVTDSGGLRTTGGFDVTVADTTPPTLAGMPDDVPIVTDDPTGTTLAYASPTATDVVDASPTVACAPASGDHVGIGTTTVTCTATDASENSAAETFDVTVTYDAPHTASAIWLEPIAGSRTVFSANRGRTIPIKVRLFVDDVELVAGSPLLTVVPCGGGSAVALPLDWNGGRWMAILDTSILAGACHTLEASVDGIVADSLTLNLTGNLGGSAAARMRAASRR